MDELDALLESLRRADGERADVGAVMRDSTARIESQPVYGEGLWNAIRSLLSAANSTHLLTEAGIVSDETIGAGVLRRIGAMLAPAPEHAASLSGALRRRFSSKDLRMLNKIPLGDATAWVRALLDSSGDWDGRPELASALVILATRVAGAGLDARLSERIPSLEVWGSPFINLSRIVDQFAEVYVERGDGAALLVSTVGVLDACIEQVRAFRRSKEMLGTTLHLSSSSLRMMQQLRRLRLLVACTAPSTRAAAIATLALRLIKSTCRPDKTRRFVGQKLELLAYLVVGHAARRGAKYAVTRPSEYWGFWLKSLLGGFLVAIFALIKIHLSHDDLAPVPQAFIYGLNYAACFVLIYLFGATLATKQPAFTASLIAESLDSKQDQLRFPYLVRSIWRSQFVSFLGNIAGASLFALLIAYGFAQLTGMDLIGSDDARELYAKNHPFKSGTLIYAGVAGFMLSAAGFFAGFVDNAVVFHGVGDRVRAGGGLFRWAGKGLRGWIAARIERSAGAISGTVLLGFMLGSAGSLGVIFGVPFDIRHIAFSSSHSALALMYAPELMTVAHVLVIVLALSLIGLINFLVSFSITLVVAIDARGLEGVDWRQEVRSVWQLAKAHPIRFFLPLGKRGTTG